MQTKSGHKKSGRPEKVIRSKFREKIVLFFLENCTFLFGDYTGKHSFVIPTPGKLVKVVLRFLDNIGLTLMYPEQFMIADEEYILDISETKTTHQYTLNKTPQTHSADESDN